MREHPLDFVQFSYNALDREAEDRLLPLAQDRGIAVIVNRPFRQGRSHPDARSPSTTRLGRRNRLPVLGAGAPEVHPGASRGDLRHPATSSAPHVRENLAAAHGALPTRAAQTHREPRGEARLMSAWWTYRPSDFLLFAPRTYFRLAESYNLDLWPAQIFALAAALLLVGLAWRGYARAGRFVALGLASAWAFIAWRFHWTHYATINWVAIHFALAFGTQAVLLIGAAFLDALRYEPRPPAARRYAGLALVVIALALQPLAA